MGKVQLYRGEEIGQKPVSEYNECYVNDFFQEKRQYGSSIISCFFTILPIYNQYRFFIPLFCAE